VQRTLSEEQSKQALAGRSIRFAPEVLAADPDQAVVAAEELGYPVVVKLCGSNVSHKTERGLVRVGLPDAASVRSAAEAVLALARPDDGVSGVLIAPVIDGTRELIAGTNVDPTFGPTVVVGVGGVLTEALADVSVRLSPIDHLTALRMLDDLRSQGLLGPVRGEPSVDRDAVAEVLVSLSNVRSVPEGVVSSIDLNPLIISCGKPVAVDALVVLDDGLSLPDASPSTHSERDSRFDALFDPAGVVVVGASTHPGKFGFVSLHNVLASGYQGRVQATNREGATILGIESSTSLLEIAPGTVDLAFVCTPAATVPDVLVEAAAIGVRAVFLASAGYGEAGEEGRSAQDELVALAEDLGVLLIGPNGQGVVSTPSSLCAQIVAPYPPSGSISVVSQSGNLVSAFLNWSCRSGVGVARALSAGNAAAVGVGDVLRYYADDRATGVALAYVEGIPDGSAFVTAVSEVTQRKPLVLLKGGSTAAGARAAASHTGSLATDDATFSGMCRQFGVSRAASAEEAFDAAAAFATQPPAVGDRVAVLTTAGGWGVLAADAITRHRELTLLELPDDLRRDIDGLLPPRWSRSNPIDLAGGETRDTVPTVLDLVAGHPAVDAVVFLGIGIQSNQARMLREGGRHPEEGIGRIVEYHERQDRRFAEAAVAAAHEHRTPVLVATELVVAFPDNPGPAGMVAAGGYCFASAERAVAALGHLVARWRHVSRS